MKRSIMLLSAVLACLMLVQPVQAVVPVRVVSASALRNILAKSTISSHIQTGLTLTAEEAAIRLYYLHLITGTGTAVNGCISFDLDRDLTRLEGAVMAVRLMGVEQDIVSHRYTHPYNDVPEWAGAYVGYLYGCGLTEQVCMFIYGFQDTCQYEEELHVFVRSYARIQHVDTCIGG